MPDVMWSATYRKIGSTELSTLNVMRSDQPTEDEIAMLIMWTEFQGAPDLGGLPASNPSNLAQLTQRGYEIVAIQGFPQGL